MRSFWSVSLQRQLAIAVGLLLVPVVAAAIWSGRSAFRERESELADQTRLVAYTTAPYINRDLTYLDGTAANIVANPVVQVLDSSLANGLLRRVIAGHSPIACIDLVRPSGDVVAHAMSSSASDDMKVGATEWWRRVFHSSKRVVSPLYVGPSGVHYVVLGYPVYDDTQQLIGALGFFVNLKTIQDSVGAIPVPDGSVVNVADRDGRLLARSLHADGYIGQLLPEDLRPVAYYREPA